MSHPQFITCTLCNHEATLRTKNHGGKPGPQYQCNSAVTHIKYPDNEHFTDIMDEARKEQLKKRPKQV